MRRRLEKFIFPLVFLLYLTAGLCVHADYGVSWDEPISRTNGLVNLKYVEERLAPGLLTDDVRQAPDLATWKDRDYGVAFELPLAALEQAFGVSDTRLYAFRHLLTFLFSTLGVLAIYKTVTLVYRDRMLGVFAALMLILSPRLFAESFYNSKDIVFMAAIAMAMYTMTRLSMKPRVSTAIAHGMVCAFALDVRIMGVVVVAATLGILAVRAMKREFPWRRLLIVGGVFLVSVALFVVLMFPFLWADPIGNFVLAFRNMASFRWPSWVLYRGQVYGASELPWHYLPVWILVSTPVLTTVLMLVGLGRGIFTLASQRLALWRDDVQMAEWSFVAMLVGPLLAVILIHAVVYDGWRHMYFVYPAFVLVAVGGIAWLRSVTERHPLTRGVLVAILLASLAANAVWIIRAHPLQNVYFNVLAGRHWKDRYDLDYWGMGNRSALEAILRSTDARSITIKANSATPLDRAVLALPRDERSRFVFAPAVSRTEFVLTNYRLESRCEGLCDLTDYELFYRKKVAGETILSVYRLRAGVSPDIVTQVERPYSPEELRHLNLRLARGVGRDRQEHAALTIGNVGSTTFSALSGTGNPLRISWRFLDSGGVPLYEWDNRVDLPRDLPAGDETTIDIPIDGRRAVPGGYLQVSLVQENLFWVHDIGVAPATMAWPR